MKILVTGGSGMVGQNLKDLEEKYSMHQFVYLSSSMCDLRNKYETECFFQDGNFDSIIHLAANVGGLYKNMNHNIEMFSDNIKINENVLSACDKYGVTKGIFILSSCIYTPNPSKFPMDESMIHESAPHPSNEGYAYAKRMLEMQCRNYNKKGRNYICLIPVNLYGKYDNFKRGEAHVIPELMHRFYLGHKHGMENYEVYGTGNPLRQFLYAGDFAKIILKVLFDESYEYGSSMIICNDELKIKEMVKVLCNVVGINSELIEYNSEMSDGCMRKTVSNEKFKKKYMEFKFMSLKDGLTLTYEWFKNNYEVVRK